VYIEVYVTVARQRNITSEEKMTWHNSIKRWKYFGTCAWNWT